MDNFIFNPIEKAQESLSFEYYGVSGAEDFVDADGLPRMAQDSPKVFAKKIIRSNSSTQYCIKLSNNNKLFNPMDYGLDERSYSIVDNVCRPSDKFKIVNKTVFDMYTNFLSSKNVSWLTKAERELI